ncbi:hypothetical protein ANCDUO_22039 [Ancylostoma duodenale]|uniref:Uncharacterized protein n=1 Tax=Ancylostoma duodenale TaxID=51022 RepID=A0A0C2FSN3_9BILA|nr:hypothetical protein ANCDUO_22039 [Ancylostoma duodenale]
MNCRDPSTSFTHSKSRPRKIQNLRQAQDNSNPTTTSSQAGMTLSRGLGKKHHTPTFAHYPLLARNFPTLKTPLEDQGNQVLTLTSTHPRYVSSH